MKSEAHATEERERAGVKPRERERNTANECMSKREKKVEYMWQLKKSCCCSVRLWPCVVAHCLAHRFSLQFSCVCVCVIFMLWIFITSHFYQYYYYWTIHIHFVVCAGMCPKTYLTIYVMVTQHTKRICALISSSHMNLL